MFYNDDVEQLGENMTGSCISIERLLEHVYHRGNLEKKTYMKIAWRNTQNSTYVRHCKLHANVEENSHACYFAIFISWHTTGKINRFLCN